MKFVHLRWAAPALACLALTAPAFGQDANIFGLSWENLEGSYSTDSALHFAVAYALAKNFTNGFRGYTHESPVWFNEGVVDSLGLERLVHHVSC